MNIISYQTHKNYKIAYDAFYYAEDIKKAYKYLNTVLCEDPNHFKALKLLGNMLIFEDKPKKALMVWEKLYQKHKNDFEINSKLAFCYEQTGQFDFALEFCEKSALCVSLGDFDKMEALYRLKIELFLNMQKISGAKRLLKNALKLLPAQYANELLRQFQNIAVKDASKVYDFVKIRKAN